jgi:hypothetical protein
MERRATPDIPPTKTWGRYSGLRCQSMTYAMRSLQRGLALLLALVSWSWSAGALLAALFWGLGLRCDEACDGQGWRRSEDAWQWNGVVALGAVAFLAGTALLFFVWRRRPGYAAVGFAVGLAAVVSLASALSPEWSEHLGRLDPREALLFIIGLAAPIAAIGLTTRRG